MEDLKNLLNNNFDENDFSVQKKYYEYLNQIIDSCLLLNYRELHDRKGLYTINQLEEYITNKFRQIDFYNEEVILFEIAEKLTKITKIKKEYLYYFSTLKALFQNYVTQEKNTELETNFYNEILNKQQNAYISKKRTQLISTLKFKLPITRKKQKTITNGIKINIVLEKTTYEDLKIIKKQLYSLLPSIHKCLANKTCIRKSYNFTEKDYSYLDNLFLNQQLTEFKIMNRFPFFNKRQIKAIKNAYYKKLLPYLENVQIKIQDIDITYLSKVLNFNYKHLMFYSQETEEKNINLFLKSLDYKEKIQLIKEKENLKILKELLPLVNIYGGFDIMTFKNLVLQFSKIKEYLIREKNYPKEITVNDILNHFSEFIELSYIYSSVENPYVVSVLGEEVIKKIISECFLSGYPEDYIYTYMLMLNNYISTIPPIVGEYDKYIYESGTSKRERLLIGKNVEYSCLGPGGAGEEAYYEALYGENADVLIIKDKYTGKFVARSLLFRRGNFIILAPFYEKDGVKDNLYNKDFLLHLKNEIKTKAKKEDNIEYIFISRHYLLENTFQYYEDFRLNNTIPHCDIECGTFLLSEYPTNIVINPQTPIKETYLRTRTPIERKETDYINDIKRIESLKVLEKTIYNYEYIYCFEDLPYDEVYIGQDWYIGVKNHEIIEKSIYEVRDPRQEIEINETIKKIREENSLQKCRRKKKTCE